MYIYIYIYISSSSSSVRSISISSSSSSGLPRAGRCPPNLHSAKGGAVERGCSGLHYIIGCFIIWYYPHPLHLPPTAPPFDEYPMKKIQLIMATLLTYNYKIAAGRCPPDVPRAVRCGSAGGPYTYIYIYICLYIYIHISVIYIYIYIIHL